MMREPALAAWNYCERFLDALFGGALNPLRHLGALASLFFLLLAVSGVYLYAVLDTSLEGAWRSIDDLSRNQWWLGGVFRSLHRYAADAFVIVTALHLLREWLLGHYRGFRRYSWLTGVPLLMFIWISGVGGFWLNWDRLGQFSAIATAELLDWLPVFGSAFARNFLDDAAMSDRLFSLFVFVHIGVALLLLFTAWFHLHRISHAEVLPSRALAAGASATLLLLALVAPVMSQAPADLSVAQGTLAIDWLLLFMLPVMYATSPGWVWALSAGALLLLFALPFATRAARPEVARVDADNCNGCRQCFDDCPYAAITMAPHPDGKPGNEIAIVDASLCASCGICTGACPPASPFRSVEPLTPGIDMPQAPIGALRERLEARLAALHGDSRIVVFGCDHGANVGALASADVIDFSLLCTGMLPPSFIEYAARHGATGVLITGCREGGCEFRLGNRWTVERLSGERKPWLRRRAPRERLRVVWADRGEEKSLQAAVRDLRNLPPAAVAGAIRRPARGVR
ncbi:MAG TPA: cytochrome b N-terminal domain-containing protein [Steroidobacteraceae bacterium]|nr:cytochrome b N-terminal domain-containing protein [Steroidobacteraceae bacterium]HNS27900.1 cytochrome b N-terminal domain-containing protein [Steroidobacteraceae bacterium]